MKLSLCRKIFRRGEEVRAVEIVEYMDKMNCLDPRDQKLLERIRYNVRRKYILKGGK